MVGVVVTGHGGFAAGMAANVKMLAGSDAELKAVDFADGMDVEVFEKQLAEAIDSYADCEAVLVLADIAGGTPYNRAAGLSMTRPKVRVISGLNSSMLMDLGIQGIEIEDKIPLTQSDKEQMFVDILPEIEADDGVAYISFYLEEDEDKEEVLANVKKELEEMRAYTNVGACTIEESQTEDVDWVNNWKQYFHQFYVDDVLIIPSWEEVKPEDEEKMIIHIDPGTAFGTGMHETTQLCIRQIRKYVTPDTTILDVGCGSGILGMLALKFGAKYSVGTDLDPCAIDATYENMEVNGITKDQYEVMIGNIIDDKEVQDKVGYEKYDIVVANILADVLVPLTPVILHQLKTGGIYITSGIIDAKEETVVEAVKAAGLEVLEVTYQGEWVSVTARKN